MYAANGKTLLNQGLFKKYFYHGHVWWSNICLRCSALLNISTKTNELQKQKRVNPGWLSCSDLKLTCLPSDPVTQALSWVLTLIVGHFCHVGLIAWSHKQNQMEAISIANFINFPGLNGHVTGLLRTDDQNEMWKPFYTHVAYLYTLINDQAPQWGRS